LIGAIYLDKGYDVVADFVEKNLISRLPRIIELGLYRDPKSELQEKTQEEVGITPNYKVIKEEGPDHRKHFVIDVCINEEPIGKGEGWSKKEAEEEAAKEALSKKMWPQLKK